MRNILVTGGAGFVGSCIVDKLLEEKDNFVVVVDNLLTGNVGRLPDQHHDRWKFIKCDCNSLEDLSAVMVSYRFDYVFHYAAVVGVRRTLENPVMVLDDIQGLRNVLNLSKNTGVKRIFFSSSSEVYGEPFEHPQNERTTPLNSRLPYAVVKNVGEAFLRSYHQEFGLEYTIFRFFNTYGPKQSRDFVMSKFIYAAANNLPITIYGDGQQTRTFCYREDNVQACVNALYQNKHVNDTVNIGNDEEVTILQLAEMIVKVTGSASPIEFLPPLPEGDMSRRRPDIAKMKLLLGRPLTAIEEGIHLTYQSGKFHY